MVSDLVILAIVASRASHFGFFTMNDGVLEVFGVVHLLPHIKVDALINSGRGFIRL